MPKYVCSDCGTDNQAKNTHCWQCKKRLTPPEYFATQDPSQDFEPDDPRPFLCERLRDIGIEAVPGFATQEEGFPGDRQWKIDIAEGPIRHVMVWEAYEGPSSESDPGRAERGIAYFVEDPRILENFAEEETDADLSSFFVIPGDTWEDKAGGLSGSVKGILESLGNHIPTRFEWENYESLARRGLARPQPGTREWTVSECAELNAAGIKSKVLEQDPITSKAAGIWIEIDEGPIRWVACKDPDSDGFGPDNFVNICYVPDSRIRPGFPRMSVEPKPVKSFPIFGRVTGVRWSPHRAKGAPLQELSEQVATSLARVPALENGFLLLRPPGLNLRSDPTRGCWTIVHDGYQSEWSQPLWAWYQEIAQHLLELPVPWKSTGGG